MTRRFVREDSERSDRLACRYLVVVWGVGLLVGLTLPPVISMKIFLLAALAGTTCAAVYEGYYVSRRSWSVRLSFLFLLAWGQAVGVLLAAFPSVLLHGADVAFCCEVGLIVLVMTFLIGALVIALLDPLLDRYREFDRSGHCQTCGYDLHGLTGDICPECGTAFTPFEHLKDPSLPR